MTDTTTKVREHYSATDLTERIKSALATITPEGQMLTVAQLAPLNQFHTRGVLATAELPPASQVDSATLSTVRRETEIPNFPRAFLSVRAVALVVALAFLVSQALGSADSHLIQLHEAFHKALREGSADQLEGLLSDQFVWTDGTGSVLTKTELLQQLRAGKLRYAELKFGETSYSEYRNAAVVTGHSTRRLADAIAPSEFLFTLTFVKVGRDWRVAAYHTSLLPPDLGQPLQVRLGYPADAKLLILNADDLAVAHSEDTASFAALDNRLITSATAMVPCPWFTEVATYAKTHPGADLGLHLTFTSEWQSYRWGPVSPRALVPSLTGPDGYFYSSVQEFVKHASPNEVEVEIRAQIERAKAMGLEPSHLDAHMHSLYATPELFQVMLKVAREYRLPIRIARNDDLFRPALTLMRREDPVVDQIFSPGEGVPASGWKDYYVNLIKNLQPGVTEIFVHLSHDDAESQAIMEGHLEWGAAWRQREFDTISSPEFRRALDENHVIRIGWRDVQGLLR